MADEESIFEDGENLQGAIGKALQEKKALLCFVSDNEDESSRWEAALLDSKIRGKLRSSTVALRLNAGSEQAGYLNAVCPVQSTPAVIIIYNAQVVANYQHGQTTFEQLQQQLEARYGTETEVDQASSSSTKPDVAGYIDLPPSEGRMRLPNNAYDHFRKLTQQFVSSGVSGKDLLTIQLNLLQSLNIDEITATVKDIQAQSETTTKPELPDEVTNRLLNTPASKMQGNAPPVNEPSARSSSSPSSGPTPSQHAATARSPPPPSSSPSTSSTTTQRTAYIASQKRAEQERHRIKSQIASDKRARRDSDRAAALEAETLKRRAELSALRAANSTTSDPKSTDIRLQVRLFDGSTIRSSFTAESTIARHVRPWVDGEVTSKSTTGAGQPYNLKLILTPHPNRTIEAGEEDTPLSDLEGVSGSGSATMVMVPVRGYVESYGAGGGGVRVAGSVVGGVQSVVGAGVGLVGGLLGGLGRLIGGGSGAQTDAGAGTASREDAHGLPGQTVGGGGGGARGGNGARVRTLADQRRDEDEEQRRRGAQLYNGMGLNVQPRKEDKDESAKE
ncbi:hypothetical protein OHC33_003497 [Knufia fluminis]|uniref:UBX domain-containing protein n=1 Tax=Knufia fluminis TaxID=191047 RepID=A0AAN8FCN6_9EURO|nr:hypothetical protein OHC33_003497 [Knufia fluminis]